MNVHPDCQGDAAKCQPKSRLLRRQKSASELDSRVLPGNEEESKWKIISHSFEQFIINETNELYNLFLEERDRG